MRVHTERLCCVRNTPYLQGWSTGSSKISWKTYLNRIERMDCGPAQRLGHRFPVVARNACCLVCFEMIPYLWNCLVTSLYPTAEQTPWCMIVRYLTVRMLWLRRLSTRYTCPETVASYGLCIHKSGIEMRFLGQIITSSYPFTNGTTPENHYSKFGQENCERWSHHNTVPICTLLQPMFGHGCPMRDQWCQSVVRHYINNLKIKRSFVEA